MGDTTKARQALLSKTSKYEEPYQYYLLNQSKGESIRGIAKKFKVDDKGLGKYIKTLEATQQSAQSARHLSNAIEGIKSGLCVIQDFQDSDKPRDNQLAQKAIKTLEEYYPHMKTIFANIQNRVLNALDVETQRMETLGELDLNNIAKAQTILKIANDTNAFIPKTPLVAVQNNIQNNQATQSHSSNTQALENKSKVQFQIEFVEKEDDKKP